RCGTARDRKNQQSAHRPRGDEKPDTVTGQRKEVDVGQDGQVRKRLTRLQEGVQTEVHRRVTHKRDSDLACDLIHLQIGRERQTRRRVVTRVTLIHYFVILDEIIAFTSLGSD